MDTAQAARARSEAAKDAAAIVGLLITGRLADIDAYLATVEEHELPALITALGGLCAAVMQELSETQLRHGEPVTAGQFLSSIATWDGRIGDGQMHD
jgi:hypothetical protein